MAGRRRGSDSKLQNVTEVSGRSVEVTVCSQWLTLVGEVAEVVAHIGIITVLPEGVVGRQQAQPAHRFGF
jgi:hypothetical protein